MVPLHSFKDYLFNLQTASKAEAKRIWKKNIKEQWQYKCAYCHSEKDITLDHIIPQSKGGLDVKTNVIACCHQCNHSKGHTPWEKWYRDQTFFSYENYEKIKTWMSPEVPINFYEYRFRHNNSA